MDNRFLRQQWPWLGALALAALLFSLSCRLPSVAAETGRASRQRSAVSALLGESRLALSGEFYELADTYFHKGVEHVPTRAFSDDIFQRFARIVSPEAHVHIAGQEVSEMMPWLEFAIQMDPHNVEIYQVTAFWLAREGGRYDLAQKVLLDGQAENPFSYALQMDRARLFLRQKNRPRALESLNAGLAFWAHAAPDGADARFDKARMLLYRSLIFELGGDRDRAIADLREILVLFPDKTYLRNRIAALEKGTSPSILASRLMHDTLRQESQVRDADEHEGEGEKAGSDHLHHVEADL